jgi:hypothetical protein
MPAAGRRRARHRKSPVKHAAVRGPGRHSESSAVGQLDRLPGGVTAIRPARQSVAAAVAVVGASVVSFTPSAPPPDIHTASPAVRLTADSSSIANIPINLIYAVANVPYNQVQALNEVARSLFFTGNWFVGSSTNIWGNDPADPGHWTAVTNLLVPFPALSGPAGDQLAGYFAAQYVVNAACDAVSCAPVVPLQPITGITALDKTIWTAAILLGYPFPILDNMFKVGPLELLSGYTFGDVVDNSGPVNSYMGFEGTHPGPNGEPLMPWSGTTFTWNPLAGWENFFESLMAPPPSLADGIHIASGQDLGQALAAALAGLVVDFNPFEPGSPFCSGQCDVPLTTEGIVRSILAWSPGNPLITEWLDLVEKGEANGATQEQRDLLIQQYAADQGVFKFNPDTMTQINAVLNSINPVLPSIAAHSGLLGQFHPIALLADAAKLLGLGAVSSATAPPASSTTALLSGTEFQKMAAKDSQSLDAKSTPVTQHDSITLSDKGSQMTAVEDGQSLDAKSTPVTQHDSMTLSGKGSQTVPPQARGGLDTPSAPGEQRKAMSATNATNGAHRAQFGPRHTKRSGGLTRAVKSVTDHIRSSISKEKAGDTTENTGDTTD